MFFLAPISITMFYEYQYWPVDHKSEHCVPLSPYSNRVLEYEQQRYLAKSFTQDASASSDCRVNKLSSNMNDVRNKVACISAEHSFDFHRGYDSYGPPYFPHHSQQIDQTDGKRTNHGYAEHEAPQHELVPDDGQISLPANLSKYGTHSTNKAGHEQCIRSDYHDGTSEHADSRAKVAKEHGELS